MKLAPSLPIRLSRHVGLAESCRPVGHPDDDSKQPESRPRVVELDVLRGAAILAVVLVHVAGRGYYLSQAGMVRNLVVDATGRFCVPAFLFASGAGIAYANRCRTSWFASFLGRHLLWIGVPYLVWSGLGIVVHRVTDVSQIVYQLLTGSAIYHLYFVVLIFEFYFLSPLIMRLCQRWPMTTLGAAVLGNVAVVTVLAYFPAAVSEQWTACLASYLNPALWFLFFTAGMVAGLNVAGLRRVLSGISPALALWIVVAAGLIAASEQCAIYASRGWPVVFFRPGNLLYSFAAIGFLWRVSGWLSVRVQRCIVALGRYSFGIYLVHPVILALVYRLMTQSLYNRLIGILLAFVLVAAMSFEITWLISRLPLGWAVVGKLR